MQNRNSKKGRLGYTPILILSTFGIIGTTLLLTGILCNFEFGLFCPSGLDSIWIEAFIGGISAGVFFLFVDLKTKEIFKKFDRKEKGKKIVFILTSVIILGATLGGLGGGYLLCYTQEDSNCPIEEMQILLGTIIGIILSAVFFILLGKHIEPSLEIIGRAYIVRTCMMNFMDLFGKADGEGRIFKTDKNREYFLEVLSDYIETFNVTNSVENKIHEAIVNHGEVSPLHDQKYCRRKPSCEEIMGMLKIFINPDPNNEDLKKYQNPIELDKRIDRNHNWAQKRSK